MLVPRSIPAMEETPIVSRARADDRPHRPRVVPAHPAPFVVPPRAKVAVLLDQDHLTRPIGADGVRGRGATSPAIRRALLEPGTKVKGNRDEVEARSCAARATSSSRTAAPAKVRPLWWRTYRYVQLEVETAEER